MKVESLFDKNTSTYSYIIIDEITKVCAVIDPVLDFTLGTGDISFESMHKIISFIEKENLKLEWILETHIHADHLTAAHYLKNKFNAKIGIGENVADVYKHWQPILNQNILEPKESFDALFQEGELISIGQLRVQVIKTPGHTPSCVSYLIENSIFVGDTLFMPTLGTARVDFPGGNAEILYNSIKKMYSMDAKTRVYVGHDYPKQGELTTGNTLIKDQKQNNIMLNDMTSLQEYIAKREARDKTLAKPKLLMPALQVNLRAGKLDEQIKGVNTPAIVI